MDSIAWFRLFDYNMRMHVNYINKWISYEKPHKTESTLIKEKKKREMENERKEENVHCLLYQYRASMRYMYSVCIWKSQRLSFAK